MMKLNEGQVVGPSWLFNPFPDSFISFLLLGPLTGQSWEEAPQVSRLPPPVHKTKVPLAMASSLFRVHELPSTHSQSSVPSSGSPERGKQVMVYQEIKREGVECGTKALLDSWGDGMRAGERGPRLMAITGMSLR